MNLEEVVARQEKSDQEKVNGKPDRIRYSLARKEEPVEIEDENGEVREYKIREMSGIERDKWMNENARRMKYDKDGNPMGLSVFNDFQASMICRCLYDERGLLVPVAIISQWPASVQKDLFELCQKLNGFVEAAREDGKKD